MKSLSIATIILIIATLCSMKEINCAEAQNNHTGPIDKLMLARAIREQGADTIQTKINQQPMEMRYGEYRMPFSLWYNVENDGTELSQEIFKYIANKIIFESSNIYNQNLNARPNLIPIDHCTCLVKIPGSQDMKTTATFFDKSILTALFKELTQE